jgi:hypothetical protein
MPSKMGRVDGVLVGELAILQDLELDLDVE